MVVYDGIVCRVRHQYGETTVQIFLGILALNTKLDLWLHAKFIACSPIAQVPVIHCVSDTLCGQVIGQFIGVSNYNALFYFFDEY